MYGKHFESMYTGSMIGSGATVFAVWGYVVANMKPPNFHVELNPELLAFILGEPVPAVISAIERLCAPDPRSRSKAMDGRRLTKEGEYLYLVVNGEHYARIQTNEDKRAYWRGYKRMKRARGDVPQNVPQGTPPDGTELKAPKVPRFHPDAKAVLVALNRHSGRVFRETDGNLEVISARLKESGVTLPGVEQMIVRQCQLWGVDPKMAEYLRPETLFAKSKFDSYYAGKELPVGNQKRQEFSDRPETVDIPMLDFGQPLAKPNPYEQRQPKIH